MANSDKNILITPNTSTGAGTDPTIDFVGLGNSALSLSIDDDSYGTLRFSSGNTTLFSINSSQEEYNFKVSNSLEIGSSGITTIGSGFSKVNISTGRGIKIPSRTTNENGSQEEGLLIFDSYAKIPRYNNGSGWKDMGDPYRKLPEFTVANTGSQGSARQNSLWAWHDGSDPHGDGEVPVTQIDLDQWIDKSGNGLDLVTRTGGSASDIRWHPGAGGRGAVYFSGNAYLSSSVQRSFGNAGGVTWFIVYKSSPNESGARSLATLEPNAPYYVNWYNQGSGNSLRWEAGNTPLAQTTFETAPDSWYVAVGRLDGSNFNMDTSFGFFHERGSGNSITNAARGVTLGEYSGSYHNNYIAESIIYNSYLDDEATKLIYDYLLKKWQIGFTS